jgi:transcriptional regulator with XRE-family HTH domain
MSKELIAMRLREARDLAGLSQGQAAKKMNMHRPTITEIEAGRRSVKSEELSAFAKLYGVDVNWLSEGVIDESKIDKNIMAAARELSSMSEKDFQKLVSTIKLIKSSGRKNAKN